MRKKIYCKYANDRNENLKIRTTIYEDSNGGRIVCKEGVNPLAKQHIENMYAIGLKIQENCKESRFELNKGELIDGILELEYLTGDTLEQRLDECLDKRDYVAFEQLVKDYTKEVRKLATETFEPTDRYYEVFGVNAVKDSKYRSMKQSDIDIIFGNIIMQDNRMVILDYEWVFDFLIPVDYILYRTMKFFALSRYQELHGHVDLYKLFQLDKLACEQFEAMERAFQEYITRSNTPLWKLYETIGKDIMFPVDACNKQQGNKKVEVVYYKNESFISKRQMVRVESDGRVVVSLEVESGVTAVRVDPSDMACLLYIDKVTWNDSDDNLINYGTNGDSSDNKLIGFCHNDPQIMMGDLDKIEGLKTITVAYYIGTIQKDLSEQYKLLVDRYNQERYESVQRVVAIQDLQRYIGTLDSKINSLQGQVTNQYTELENKNGYIVAQQAEINRLAQEKDCLAQEINRLQSSASWRITKPLRFIMRKIRR